MIYTPRLQKAIDISITAHMGQTRKGKQVPYIIHPLGVGIILARTGASEDIIIAGILHDTIEDTEMTFEDIRKEFGAEVARMVNDVTEQDKSLLWEERKRLALEHVKHMQNDSMLVKSADVLNNMTDQIIDYKKEGDKMFLRFNASKEKQVSRYENLINELKKAWPENPLLADLEVNLEIFIKSLKQKISSSEYPRFFDVDGTPVRIDKDGEEVVCSTWSGHPYGLGKAVSEGTEITEEEFNRAVAALK